MEHETADLAFASEPRMRADAARDAAELFAQAFRSAFGKRLAEIENYEMEAICE